jgi:hypothetical protein
MNPERIQILDRLADAGIDILPASEFGGPTGHWVAVKAVGRSIVTVVGPHPSHDWVERQALESLPKR